MFQYSSNWKNLCLFDLWCMLCLLWNVQRPNMMIIMTSFSLVQFSSMHRCFSARIRTQSYNNRKKMYTKKKKRNNNKKPNKIFERLVLLEVVNGFFSTHEPNACCIGIQQPYRLNTTVWSRCEFVQCFFLCCCCCCFSYCLWLRSILHGIICRLCFNPWNICAHVLENFHWVTNTCAPP